MSLRVTILGCGSSGGVPRIGGDWGAADPNESKNRRRRCSILIEKGGGDKWTRILIDTSPDLYDQMFGKSISWLDGVLYTHHHADQTHGINDLRAFFLNRFQTIQTYMDKHCADIITRSFSYCFEPLKGSGYPKFLDFNQIEVGRPIKINGEGGEIEFLPFLLNHGAIDSLGFRFDGIAYTPDVLDIPDESLTALEGLECWIVDALRYKPHPTHFDVSKTLAWIERLKPNQAVLTNMHIDLDYQTLKKELPENVIPAFDDMILTFA